MTEHPFAVGDRVRYDGTPLTVTVTAVSECTEQGCPFPAPLITFDDPLTGERDTEHASFFTLVR